MRRLLLSAALTAALATNRASAQPGGDFGMLNAPSGGTKGLPRGVEPEHSAAAPPNPFPLPANPGGWMICAASYAGPEGADLARQVCVDLRNNHRLAAYIFNRGEDERRKQEEEWQAKVQANPGVPMRRARVRIPDQYAVLTGQFKSFEDAAAFLPKVRSLALPNLKLAGGKMAYELMTYQSPENAKEMRRAYVNPYHTAMVVRNPQAGGPATARGKWDPIWKVLNEDEDYSLLKNPKPWTLVVKEYMGARTIQDRSSKGGFAGMLGLGGKEGGALGAAEQQARELARFLNERRFGFKTWVLHTRYSSVVCVGGFNGPDDPDLHRVRDQLTQLRFSAKGGTNGDPIGLLPNPVPVEVPRF